MDFGGPKVLMLSTDRNILVPGSSVAERMKEYGKLVEELHIVLLSDASHALVNTALGSNVFVYPTNSYHKFLRPLGAARLGKKIVLEKKFVRGKSLITTQDPFECGWAALKIKKKWRLPLEVQLHTDPFSPFFTGFLNMLRKRIARKVLLRADGVRVVTRVLADRVSKEFGIGNITVLPIYIDIKKIEEGYIPFDLHSRFGWKVILLMVARLTGEKNIGLALRVLKNVLDTYPDAGLVVVGEGPDSGELEAQAKELGIEQNTAFVGWQENLAPYYKGANIFIQTSLFEGYGLALVEAGLSSLPVVTTPVGIAQDLQDGVDAEVVLPNAGHFAKRILKLIGDESGAKAEGDSLKRTLQSKLLSKEDYLKRLKDNWQNVAIKISL